MALALSGSSTKLTEERRILIKALLESFEKQGGRVVFPHSEDEDDAILDTVHVPSLLEALRTGKYVDVSSLANESLNEIGGGGSGLASEGMDPDMEQELGIRLALDVPQLDIALNEHELQGFAFMLFCLFCVDKDDDKEQTHLTSAIRRQLELSQSCAEDIIKVTKSVLAQTKQDTSSTDSGEVGVELLMKLIVELRPKHFRKLRDFVKWRDAIARIIVQVVKESVDGSKLEQSAKAEDVALLIANLRGAVRRLCFQEEEEYMEQEYADAVDAVTTIIQKLMPHSRSGFSFTWGMRVRVWEILLCALLESEEDDVYIDETDEIKPLLLERLAPRLRISPALHDACFAWIHFRELYASHAPGLAPIVKKLLTTMGSNDPAVEELDQMYLTEISKVCDSAMTELMMDYHAKLPRAEIMTGIVDVFLTLTQSMSGSKELHPSLPDCIESSCCKAFKRELEKEKKSQKDTHAQLRDLAQKTQQLYERELVQYTGPLAPHCPEAAAIAAKTLHECYGQELKPVLYELESIPDQVVQMLKAADELEGVLLRDTAEEKSASTSIVPWNVMEAISDLLANWVDNQLHKIKEWRERLSHEETWQPQSDVLPVASSALELKRLLGESITLVFSLDLTFPPELVDKFVAGLARNLEEYSNTTMNDIRGEDGCKLLVPRVPDMTRYKRELAESALQKEQRSFEGKPNRRHSRLKSILLDAGVMKMVPLITDSENYQWFNNLKINTLVVRINSLHYLRESIPELSTAVQNTSEGHISHKELIRQGSAEPLHVASGILEQCIHVFCEFVGTKVVFWDGRLPWLEQLYRHQVSTSRIDFILDDLHKTLSDIHALSLPLVRNDIVLALLEACVRCMRRVLLEGGPYRLFKWGSVGDDRELIEEDVKKLKDLFNSEEEGLPMSVIEEATKPVSEVLVTMMLSTSDLIQMAEDARKNNIQTLSVYSQILAHRADHAASKWLKKALKTPKKIKSKV